MKLSIIIPVYNCAEYLHQCIASIFCQGIHNDDYEIILIDDASQDNSATVVAEYAKRHSNIITLAHKNNCGQGHSRNEGIARAKGKYIAFIDADDYLKPNTLNSLLEKCIENNLDICAYRMEKQLADGKTIEDLVQPFSTDYVFSGEYCLTHGVIIASVCTNLYNRTFLLNKHLLFDEKIKHEDVEFNARAYAFAQRVMFTDVCGYVYRWNSTSTDRNTDKQKRRILLNSDIYLARIIRDFASTNPISKDLKEFYQKYTNSIIVSTLYKILITKNEYTAAEKKDIIRLMYDEGVYPIKGKTKSAKTTYLIPLFNNKLLCKLLINIRRMV